MKKVAMFSFCLVLILLHQLLMAEDKPARVKDKPSITAEQVMDKAIKALGGKEALRKVKSAMCKGNGEKVSLSFTEKDKTKCC
ncbi:MAG: hypothetical protein ABFD46_05985 [Armatimonadota bacterium]